MDSELKKHREAIFQDISSISEMYFVYRGIRNSNSPSLLKKNSFFWDATTKSLERGFLLGLAKMFDNGGGKGAGSPRSVWWLIRQIKDPSLQKEIKKILSSHKQTISKLQQLRNKDIAHDDLEFFGRKKFLYRKYKITFGEIESLISDLPRVLEMIEFGLSGKNVSYVFGGWCQDAEADAASVIEDIDLGKMATSKAYLARTKAFRMYQNKHGKDLDLSTRKPLVAHVLLEGVERINEWNEGIINENDR